MRRFAFPADHPHAGRSIELPPYHFVDGVCTVAPSAAAAGRVLTRFYGCVELAEGEPAPGAPPAAPYVPTVPEVLAAGYTPEAADAIVAREQAAADPAAAASTEPEAPPADAPDPAHPPADEPPDGAAPARLDEDGVRAAAAAIAQASNADALAAVAAIVDVRVARAAAAAERGQRRRKPVLAALDQAVRTLTPAPAAAPDA